LIDCLTLAWRQACLWSLPHAVSSGFRGFNEMSQVVRPGLKRRPGSIVFAENSRLEQVLSFPQWQDHMDDGQADEGQGADGELPGHRFEEDADGNRQEEGQVAGDGQKTQFYLLLAALAGGGFGWPHQVFLGNGDTGGLAMGAMGHG